MKTDLIIISIVMVLLVFLPFYLLPILQLRGNKKISQLFKAEAARFNLNIDIRESWNLNITGIDSAAQRLLVLQTQEEIKVHHFDLKEVKHTELLVSSIPFMKNGKTENLLQRVDIIFSYYSNEERKVLCLYDYDLNTYQEFEVKNAEKLNKNLQRLIMAHPVIKRTA